MIMLDTTARHIRLTTALMGLLSLSLACVPIPEPGGPDPLLLSFDFRDGTTLDWQADLSDYGSAQQDGLQFLAELREFPVETGIEGTGYYLQSFNTPDDLFTFIKRRLGPSDGLAVGQNYRVSFDIYFASNAPAGCFGVGGAPGESVYLKAGASSVEPIVVPQGDEFRLSVDKGDQSTGGAAASVVDDVANGVPCDLIPVLDDAPYVLLLRAHTHETQVTTGADGTLWLLVGVESGYESLTGIYYQRIDVHIQPVE